MAIRDDLKSNFTVQVLASLAVALLLYLIGAAVGLLPSLITVARQLIAHLGSTVSLPRWVLWPLIFCAAYCVFKVARYVLKPDPRRAYREDDFFGFHAKWQWSRFGLWPKDMKIQCPRCRTQLVSRSEPDIVTYGSGPIPGISSVIRFYSYCETCGRRVADGNVSHLEGKTERQIERNLETGEWKKKVEQSKLR